MYRRRRQRPLLYFLVGSFKEYQNKENEGEDDFWNLTNMRVEKSAELLCRVDFPLYQALMVSPRHLLLAGGGGSAKTGVKNGFEIVEITHDGRACLAESVCRYDSGAFAVMNAASGAFDPSLQRTLLAVGNDGKCQMYSLELTRNSKREKDSQLRRRSVANGGVPKNSNNNNNNEEDFLPLSFSVHSLASFQTDFNMPEPYQKVVKMSPDMKYLATGGDDGVLRLWNLGNYSRMHEIEAHDKEIDDIDFSPDGNKIVTISKDHRALVWNARNGKKHAELSWDSPKKIKYAYKRIRFGKIEGNPKNYKIFTVVNPIGTSKAPSYLQQWETKAFLVLASVAHNGSYSALAVSDNGNFVATGTMFDGTVDIYTAFNLRILKRVENSHSTFITGLEFLSTSDESAPCRGFSDASVVSISVDHRVCIHHIPRLRHISMFWASIFIVFLLCGVFIVCSYLGF